MDEKLLKSGEKFRGVFKEKYSEVLLKEAAQIEEFAEKAFSKLEALTGTFGKDKKTALDKIISLNYSLQRELNQKHLEIKAEDFDSRFYSILGELDEELEKLPEFVTVVQDEDRFKPLVGDSFLLKVLKFFKRVLYSITNFPIKFGNLLRRIGKKELKKDKEWKRKIPYRRLNEYYFKALFFQKVIPFFKPIEIARLKTYQMLFALTREINEYAFNNIDKPEKTENPYNMAKKKEKALEEVLAFKETVKSWYDRPYNELFELYEYDLERVSTIELSSSKFQSGAIDKIMDGDRRDFRERTKERSFANFAVFDQWRLYEETTLYRFKNLKFCDILSTDYERRVNLFKSNYVDEFKKLIDELTEKIDNFSGSEDELRNLIDFEKEELYQTITMDLLPKAMERLADDNLSLLVDELEGNIRSALKEISDDRYIVKTENFKDGSTRADLEKISPKEIIRYENLPGIVASLTDVKSGLINYVEELQKDLRQAGEIADFNLESAAASFEAEDKEGEELTEKKIAIDGLKRALNKLDEAYESVDRLKSLMKTRLKPDLEAFNQDLTEMSEPKLIFKKKLAVTKAKTTQRAEEIRERTAKTIKNLYPIIIEFFKRQIDILTGRYKRIAKLYGFEVEEKKISHKISDFLIRTKKAIEELPFTYQRLFRVEPLIDERFWELRAEELELLKEAYENWLRGNYSPAAIVGEEGGGKASLLNIFLNKLENERPVDRIKMETRINDNIAFMNFWRETLDKKELHSIEDIINNLNSSRNKRIVILENVHFFFMRTIDGSNTMKNLIRIIAKTSDKILWISTFNKYAWNYLCKTIDIGTNLGFVVQLRELTDERVVNIIMRRHRVSGYKLRFEPCEQDEKNAKFKRLSEVEKQKHLEKAFFKDLNDIAESNVSIALLFWLRAANCVEGDSITVDSLKNLNFSFMDSLSMEKVFVCHVLILHERLNAEQAARVLSIPKQKCSDILVSLYDAGVTLMNDKDEYYLNPLLYRQTVNLLKLRNLLH